MNRRDVWLTDPATPLLTDLYQLTMVQAYLAEGMLEPATFDLFVRTLPESRNFFLACGVDDALEVLESLHFDEEAIERLRSLEMFSEALLDYLAGFRFTGDVRAVAEGTPVFENEPILEVVAPLPEAQLAETVLLNQVQYQTVLASKAARVALAAGEKKTVDFGLRRAHGAEAGLKAARAGYVAGLDATSNVLAGVRYGIPVSGTMAHSYVEAHDDEFESFGAFAKEWGETVLLVDTYDTLEGVRKVVRLAEEMGEAFKIKAVRLDSGDLGELAKKSRQILDGAGLQAVGIVASGGLDEHKIRDLIRSDAPIDGFGVGTRLDVAADAPYFDAAFKLVEYAGKPRMKLSAKKDTLPGKKQVFRVEEHGEAQRDVIALASEEGPGRALLRQVMRDGQRIEAGEVSLEAARRRAAEEIGRLPPRVRELAPADPAYPVEASDRLESMRRDLRARLERGEAPRRLR